MGTARYAGHHLGRIILHGWRGGQGTAGIDHRCRVLGALGLWAFVLVTGSKVPMTRKVWLAFLGMGLLNNAIPFTLIVWGQHHIASGLASILNATTPLFTVLVANLLTRNERINPGKLVGVLIGICGVA